MSESLEMKDLVLSGNPYILIELVGQDQDDWADDAKQTVRTRVAVTTGGGLRQTAVPMFLRSLLDDLEAEARDMK